jgi:hypothetical protein
MKKSEQPGRPDDRRKSRGTHQRGAPTNRGKQQQEPADRQQGRSAGKEKIRRKGEKTSHQPASKIGRT